jgi:hypothetical protein
MRNNRDDGQSSGMEVRLLLFYLVGVDSIRETNIFYFLKNTSDIPVDNGSSLNTLIIKPTSRFINITISMDTVSVL